MELRKFSSVEGGGHPQLIIYIFVAESTSGSEEFESCDDNNSEEEHRSLPTSRNSLMPKVCT